MESGCFLDAKTFNLDGPDVLASYGHDLRREEKCFLRGTKEEHLSCSGGYFMLWYVSPCARGRQHELDALL